MTFLLASVEGFLYYVQSYSDNQWQIPSNIMNTCGILGADHVHPLFVCQDWCPVIVMPHKIVFYEVKDN